MTAIPFPDPELTDGTIRIRPWREADLPAAFAATQDELIPRFTYVPVRQSEAALRDFFDSQEPAREAGEALAMIIADAGTGELLGSIGLLRFEWEHRRGEIGYWLARDARGRGAATRAVNLVAPWALRELDLARLALMTDLDNRASQRVAERAGFTREGILRAYEERKGERHDVVAYSLVPSDLA
jgi:ribosomal-protein-alanine N-acetyltransferase